MGDRQGRVGAILLRKAGLEMAGHWGRGCAGPGSFPSPSQDTLVSPAVPSASSMTVYPPGTVQAVGTTRHAISQPKALPRLHPTGHTPTPGPVVGGLPDPTPSNSVRGCSQCTESWRWGGVVKGKRNVRSEVWRGGGAVSPTVTPALAMARLCHCPGTTGASLTPELQSSFPDRTPHRSLRTEGF